VRRVDRWKALHRTVGIQLLFVKPGTADLVLPSKVIRDARRPSVIATCPSGNRHWGIVVKLRRVVPPKG